MPSDPEYEFPPPAPTVAKLTPDPAGAGAGAAVDCSAAADGSALAAVSSSAPAAADDPVPGAADASAPAASAAAGEPGKTREPSLWPERLAAAAASLWRWSGQPRVRLATVGVLLLLVGGVMVTNSVWTLPLVVVGVLMVVVAWVGRRLEGRIAVEWGESGTEVLFRATIKAPTHEAQLPAPAPSAEPARVTEPATARPESLGRHEDVIEGEAHTVEIDVSDLKALIAAVETAEAHDAADESAPREFRLHRTPHGMRASDPR